MLVRVEVGPCVFVRIWVLFRVYLLINIIITLFYPNVFYHFFFYHYCFVGLEPMQFVTSRPGPSNRKAVRPASAWFPPKRLADPQGLFFSLSRLRHAKTTPKSAHNPGPSSCLSHARETQTKLQCGPRRRASSSNSSPGCMLKPATTAFPFLQRSREACSNAPLPHVYVHDHIHGHLPFV